MRNRDSMIAACLRCFLFGSCARRCVTLIQTVQFKLYSMRIKINSFIRSYLRGHQLCGSVMGWITDARLKSVPSALRLNLGWKRGFHVHVVPECVTLAYLEQGAKTLS